MTDLLVLGSGGAGLSTAVRARDAGLSVTVLTKGELGWSATRYAQGGVAAALVDDDDSPALHGFDTLAAGGGLNDPDAVRVLAAEGPRRVRELIDLITTQRSFELNSQVIEAGDQILQVITNLARN